MFISFESVYYIFIVFSYYLCSNIIVSRCLIRRRHVLLTNDIDLWLRTESYKSIHRIDHASPTKENGNPKKSTVLSAGEKYVELPETPTVEKKAEKAPEIACANHVTK